MKEVEIRLPLWSAIMIAAVIVGAFAYMTAALRAAERNNSLLRENVRLRQDLREKTERLHRIEVGLVNVYRTTLYDLAERTGLSGREDGSVFLTIFKAVDNVTEPNTGSGVGGGSEEDEALSEMQWKPDAENSVEGAR